MWGTALVRENLAVETELCQFPDEERRVPIAEGATKRVTKKQKRVVDEHTVLYCSLLVGPGPRFLEATTSCTPQLCCSLLLFKPVSVVYRRIGILEMARAQRTGSQKSQARQ